MTQPSSRQPFPRLNGVLPGLATALLASLLSGGCTDQDSAERSASGQAERASPEELYIDHCGSCHGVDGEGDGPLASEFRKAPANLRLLAQNNDGRFPNIDVQRSIDGRGMPRAHGLPDMPVWGRAWIRQGLSEAEIKARAIEITGYIASIQE